MKYQFSPAAERALAEAERWATRAGSNDLDLPELLLGLLAETECRAAAMLRARQIDTADVRQRWPTLAPRDSIATTTGLRLSASVQASIRAAEVRLPDFRRPLTLTTELLLLGIVASETDAADWLRAAGFDVAALEAEIRRLYGHAPSPAGAAEPEPCEIEDETAAWDGHTAEPHLNSIAIWRILDAEANRAREGLRVVEDYLRFALDDEQLTGLCKGLRHELVDALAQLPPAWRVAARDTEHDVGTRLTTARERRRDDAESVLEANFARLSESLRSLEEYGKLCHEGFAATIEGLRYRLYTLQRAVGIACNARKRLENCRLYILLDGCRSVDAFERLARSLVEAGADAIQLRDKQLPDRELLDRARRLRALTRGTPTLFVMNDRPDLAVLAEADGVHVGQEELTVGDVRRIVGPHMLVGVSTHSLQQAQQAVLDGASYIGVGPTFPSGTKQFDQFTGVELLREVAAAIRLPAFAIGGIDTNNLPQVLGAGFTRVAVGRGITAAADPAATAREMLARLQGTAEQAGTA